MSISEFNMYLMLLEEQYEKVYTDKDYDEIIKKMKYEFNIKITIDKLDILFNAGLYEEHVSKEELIRNIFN